MENKKWYALVVFLVSNPYKAICVVLVLIYLLGTVSDVGTMPSLRNEPYGWDLPFCLLVFLLPPVAFAYLAGRHDGNIDNVE